MQKIDHPFNQRIDELEVARVLQLISEVPNKREKPQPGDLAGTFDFWFDGGACRIITGSTEYVLTKGIKVEVIVTPGLNVKIQFPDGRSVDIRQR